MKNIFGIIGIVVLAACALFCGVGYIVCAIRGKGFFSVTPYIADTPLRVQDNRLTICPNCGKPKCFSYDKHGKWYGTCFECGTKYVAKLTEAGIEYIEYSGKDFSRVDSARKMHEIFDYCPDCGDKLNLLHSDGCWASICPNCGKKRFINAPDSTPDEVVMMFAVNNHKYFIPNPDHNTRLSSAYSFHSPDEFKAAWDDMMSDGGTGPDSEWCWIIHHQKCVYAGNPKDAPSFADLM